jgi:hypothetical protein
MARPFPCSTTTKQNKWMLVVCLQIKQNMVRQHMKNFYLFHGTQTKKQMIINNRKCAN